MKGMPQKSVHLRTSSPPDHGVGSVKEVSKPYLHMGFFFFTLAALLFQMVRRTSFRGV